MGGPGGQESQRSCPCSCASGERTGKLLQQLRLMGHYAAVGADLQRKGASQGTFSVPWVSHPEHLPLLQHERCDTVQTG